VRVLSWVRKEGRVVSRRGPVDEMYLLEWEERSKRSFFGTKARAREGRIHQYPGRKEENEER
jgi:hypothetical protein